MKSKAVRQYGYDNVRFILILCVVLGHLLEPLGSSPAQKYLYLIIYTFHMPVFLFLSGYFARFSREKLSRLVGLYLLFQCLYQVFGSLAAGKGITVQYLKPDWILWYLPVLVYCHLLLPALDRLPRFPAIAVSIGVSLAVGFCDAIGYGLSASRFFVFCPYFILGYRAGKRRQAVEAAASRLPKGMVPALLAGNLVFCLLLISTGRVNARILYGSYSYRIGYGPFTRLLLYLLGFSWVGWFLILARTLLSRRIPLISAIGRNTLPIYLLHGFAVRLISKWSPVPEGLPGILFALVLSVLLAAMLGNDLMGRAFSPGIRCRRS